MTLGPHVLQTAMPQTQGGYLTATNPVETAEKIYLAMVPYMGLLHGQYESVEDYAQYFYDAIKSQNNQVIETIIASVEKNQPNLNLGITSEVAGGMSQILQMQADLLKRQSDHWQNFVAAVQKQWMPTQSN